jgi:tetratricopeptide (TPR) repeat protein
MTRDEEFELSLHLAEQLLDGARAASDVAEANALVNRALRLRPRETAGWLVKTQVLLRMEDGPAALGTVEMALQQGPQSAEAHALRAAALAQMERFSEALRAIQRAFRLCEDEEGDAEHDALREDLYYEKAAILDALDRTSEAVATFEEGLLRYPDSDLLKAGIEPLRRMQRRKSWQVLDGGLARQADAAAGEA